METLATIESFSVRTASEINGLKTTYTFTLTTRYVFIDGDNLKFSVPPEVTLPGTVEELNVQPLPRIVDGESVSDDLRVDFSGQTVIVTFVKVAPTTETYKFTLDNIKNPPSEQRSGGFVNIISTNKENWNVQEYVVEHPDEPPTIQNKIPATIVEHSLLQYNSEPAAPTTYEIWFIPINPIPTQGSIQISWP